MSKWGPELVKVGTLEHFERFSRFPEWIMGDTSLCFPSVFFGVAAHPFRIWPKLINKYQKWGPELVKVSTLESLWKVFQIPWEDFGWHVLMLPSLFLGVAAHPFRIWLKSMNKKCGPEMVKVGTLKLFDIFSGFPERILGDTSLCFSIFFFDVAIHPFRTWPTSMTTSTNMEAWNGAVWNFGFFKRIFRISRGPCRHFWQNGISMQIG